MAHTYSFNTITAVVADARKPRLQVLRSSLYYMGFRETEWADTAKGLEEMAERVKPDLIISALDLPDPGSSASAFFRKIRTGMSRVDPFTPIIAVLSEASPTTVRRGVDSGADDVLIHPWPDGYLDQRVQNLIHGRKPFVVTSDYVGPDRRSMKRAGAQAPMITPPNVLEAKALKRQEHNAVADALSTARRTLTAYRARALAGLIVRLIGELEGRYARGAVASDVNAETLSRLVLSAQEANLQLRLGRDTTTATSLMAAVARHGKLCRDAQEFGRITGLTELTTLARRVTKVFDLEDAMASDKPAADRRGERVAQAPRIAAE